LQVPKNYEIAVWLGEYVVSMGFSGAQVALALTQSSSMWGFSK